MTVYRGKTDREGVDTSWDDIAWMKVFFKENPSARLLFHRQGGENYYKAVAVDKEDRIIGACEGPNYVSVIKHLRNQSARGDVADIAASRDARGTKTTGATKGAKALAGASKKDDPALNYIRFGHFTRSEPSRTSAQPATNDFTYEQMRQRLRLAQVEQEILESSTPSRHRAQAATNSNLTREQMRERIHRAEAGL